MATEKDPIVMDEDIEPDTEADDGFTINMERDKIDARRRLEEYMELKKLRELTEF